MSQEMIVVRNLTKKYKQRAVVADVSFSVGKAEVLGLLGPNGAGKTTIINMLTGLTRPSCGRITILGRDLSRSPIVIKKNIGHVYANMSFFPQLTPGRNLQFFGRFYGMSRTHLRSRIEELLEFVGLAGEKKKSVGAFSQGMKQRLGIAKALLHDPQILFLDEATSGIDIRGTNLLRGYIYDLRARGKTILLSSHQLAEIELVCDRTALLDDGRMLAIDTPRRLKERLRGVMFKYQVRGTSPIPLASREDVELRFLGDSSILVASEDLSNQLVGTLGPDAVEVLEPSLEDVFLWLLRHNSIAKDDTQ